MLISRMGIDKQIIKMDLMPRTKAPLGFRELSESLKRGANFLFTLVCVSSKEDVQSFFYQFSYRFIIPRSGTTASLKSMKKARSVEKPLLSTALVRSREGLVGGRAQHTGPGQTACSAQGTLRPDASSSCVSAYHTYDIHRSADLPALCLAECSRNLARNGFNLSPDPGSRLRAGSGLMHRLQAPAFHLPARPPFG